MDNTQISEEANSFTSSGLHDESAKIKQTRSDSPADSDSSKNSNQSTEKKKDKKLVFLSRSVLQSVRESSPTTTGTQIAYEILELYKRFSDKVDFKNVQRRVYDALNVLSAMDIIQKEKNHIFYNPDNEFIDDTILPNTVPRKNKRDRYANSEAKPTTKPKLETVESQEHIEALRQKIDQTKKRNQKLIEKQEELKQRMKGLKNSSKTNQEVVNQNTLDGLMKSNYIYELLKQYVSIKEVIRRNEFRQEPIDLNNDDFKQLRFFLIKFPAGSKINVDHARDRSMLAVNSDKAFLVLNENHLF